MRHSAVGSCSASWSSASQADHAGQATPGGIILTDVLGIVGAMLGGWLGRVLGLYREGEAAVSSWPSSRSHVLGIYRLVLPGRTRNQSSRAGRQ